MTMTQSNEQLARDVLETIQHTLDAVAGYKEHPITASEVLLRVALPKAKELVERVGWKPIESAPKDGTRVIVWDDEYNQPSVAFYKDRAKYCAGKIQDFNWVISDSDSDDTHYTETAFAPTHWMPIPAPPQPDEGKL